MKTRHFNKKYYIFTRRSSQICFFERQYNLKKLESSELSLHYSLVDLFKFAR